MLQFHGNTYHHFQPWSPYLALFRSRFCDDKYVCCYHLFIEWRNGKRVQDNEGTEWASKCIKWHLPSKAANCDNWHARRLMKEYMFRLLRRELCSRINTLRPRRYGCQFPNEIFLAFCLNEIVWIVTAISMKYVSNGLVYNTATLVQIMTCRRTIIWLDDLGYWRIYALLGLNELTTDYYLVNQSSVLSITVCIIKWLIAVTKLIVYGAVVHHIVDV